MIVNQNVSNQSFTSVVPMKIVLDGVATTDDKIITATMRKLSSALKRTDNLKNPIRDEFVKYDRDFTTNNGTIKKNVAIRRDWDGKYLFTDKHADAVTLLGERIGHAIKHLGENDGYEAAQKSLKGAKTNYAVGVQKIIKEGTYRIRECFDYATKVYYGDNMELLINVVSKGNKMNIENVSFVKLQKPAPNPQTQTLTQKVKQKVIQLSLF